MLHIRPYLVTQGTTTRGHLVMEIHLTNHLTSDIQNNKTDPMKHRRKLHQLRGSPKFYAEAAKCRTEATNLMHSSGHNRALRSNK